MVTKYVSIDEMLNYTGAYGPYQWILNAIFSFIMMPQTFQTLIMYFAAISPPWKCTSNSTVCLSNKTFSYDDQQRCLMSRSDWEYTEPQDFSVTTQFDLICDDAWIISLTTGIYFIGWLFGALILGSIADCYGRKTVYFPCTGLTLIIGFATAFSPNIATVLVLRFFAGILVPGGFLQGIILISELVDGKHRPLASLLIFLGQVIAQCLTGVLAYFIHNWKLLFMLCTAPYVFIFIFYPLVPESVRWLQLKGKTKKLNTIFMKIAKWNKKTMPDKTAITTNKTTKIQRANPLYLFKTRKVAVTTLVQGYSWMFTNMVYYGLSLGADDLGGNLYLNYILVSIMEFPALVSAIYLCDKFGRKKTVLSSAIIASISCTIVSFIPISHEAKYIRTTLAMSGKFFVSITYNGIYTWSVELLPTEIRSAGMGFLQITGRIGSAASPFIVKGLKTVYEPAPFITMGSLGLIGFLLQFILPETKGVALPDTIVIPETEDNMETEKLICELNGTFEED